MPDVYIVFVDTSKEKGARIFYGLAGPWFGSFDGTYEREKICSTRKKWRTIMIDYHESNVSLIPAVLVHEIGHLLRLPHEYDCGGIGEKSVMNADFDADHRGITSAHIPLVLPV